LRSSVVEESFLEESFHVLGEGGVDLSADVLIDCLLGFFVAVDERSVRVEVDGVGIPVQMRGLPLLWILRTC